jgi:large subunit ribosomal protein L18
MDKFKQKKIKRVIRHKRVRSRVAGDAKRPRLVVFRSDKHIYAQIIDDATGKTLASASDMNVKIGKKSDKASEVGKLIAKAAADAKVKQVSFDRGGFKYHGRVKALAEAAREAGLEF